MRVVRLGRDDAHQEKEGDDQRQYEDLDGHSYATSSRVLGDSSAIEAGTFSDRAGVSPAANIARSTIWPNDLHEGPWSLRAASRNL